MNILSLLTASLVQRFNFCLLCGGDLRAVLLASCRTTGQGVLCLVLHCAARGIVCVLHQFLLCERENAL